MPARRNSAARLGQRVCLPVHTVPTPAKLLADEVYRMRILIKFLTVLMTIVVIGLSLTVYASKAKADADPNPNQDGMQIVFMGHSFFVPYAELMPEYAANAGISGHSQTVVSFLANALDKVVVSGVRGKLFQCSVLRCSRYSPFGL